MNDVLEYTGSLLKDGRYIVSPYEMNGVDELNNLEAFCSPIVKNGASRDFVIDYRCVDKLCVINGLGVTLGDSIIGIAALDYIKHINPDIHISVVRPDKVASYVNQVYELAGRVIDDISYMPVNVNTLEKDVLNIELGNILFWKEFHQMEMHEFFLKNLGIPEFDIHHGSLSNSWLNHVDIKDFKLGDYALFSPRASTAIRSIPSAYHKPIIDRIVSDYGLKVVGFMDIDHPAYINASNLSLTTVDYISIVSHSKFVYTCDTSTLHISAGFNIPTFCIFTTILPELRTRFYSHCESIFIGDEKITGIQGTENEALVSHLNNLFRNYYNA